MHLKATLTGILSGDATDAAALLGTKESTLPEDINWARAVLRAFGEGAEADIGTGQQLRNRIAGLDMFFPGEGERLLPQTDRERLTDALKSEHFYERLPDVRAAVHSCLGRVAVRYQSVREEVAQELKLIQRSLEVHPDWSSLLESDREAVLLKLQEHYPADGPGDRDPVEDLTKLLISRNGLAGFQRDLEAEIIRRVPNLPSDEPPEVQHVTLSTLRPTSMITSEADLEDWLRSLRIRLLGLLRSNKHIELGD